MRLAQPKPNHSYHIHKKNKGENMEMQILRENGPYIGIVGYRLAS
jgi:hypothetical protein